MDNNISKLEDDIDTLAKLRNISPMHPMDFQREERQRRHKEKHANDFQRQFSAQERQRRHEQKSRRRARHQTPMPTQELQGATSTSKTATSAHLWCLLLVLILLLTRSWPTSTNSSSNDQAHVDAARSMVKDVRPRPLHWSPSQALLMTWFLHQVPPPQWPPYGKMKTFYVTIAKAKDMIRENAPSSCAHYAMEMVT